MLLQVISQWLPLLMHQGNVYEKINRFLSRELPVFPSVVFKHEVTLSMLFVAGSLQFYFAFGVIYGIW